MMQQATTKETYRPRFALCGSCGLGVTSTLLGWRLPPLGPVKAFLGARKNESMQKALLEAVGSGQDPSRMDQCPATDRSSWAALQQSHVRQRVGLYFIPTNNLSTVTCEKHSSMLHWTMHEINQSITTQNTGCIVNTAALLEKAGAVCAIILHFACLSMSKP